MQGIDQIVASRKKTKRLRLVIAAIVVLAVIVAIVVPVGIILSKKKAPALVFGSTVIVPLYIYPDANAWDPLFKA
jgi:hypothetical protein